jgi:SGT1 protein
MRWALWDVGGFEGLSFVLVVWHRQSAALDFGAMDEPRITSAHRSIISHLPYSLGYGALCQAFLLPPWAAVTWGCTLRVGSSDAVLRGGRCGPFSVATCKMERRDSDDLGAEEGILAFNLFFSDEGSDASDIDHCCERIQSKIAGEATSYIWHSAPPVLAAVRPQNSSGTMGAISLSSFTPHNLKRPCISGVLEYGDNIEDEWFATWLLFQATTEKDGASTVLQLRDSDGDYLLIEAADAALPSWIQPERMGNRVFVAHGGRLCLVPPRSLGGLGGDDEPVASAEEAADWVLANPLKAIAGDDIQAAIADRLRGYPKKAFRNMHCALTYLPPSAAAVLNAAPQLIASAVSAFYSRDSSEVVRASKMTFFAPEEVAAIRATSPTSATPQDASEPGPVLARPLIPALIPMSVPMTRHLFAQLVQQRFLPPKSYAAFMPPPPISTDPSKAIKGGVTAEEYQRYDLGLKIATGLEILMRRGEGAKIVTAAASATANAATTGAATIEDSSSMRDSERFKRYLNSLVRRGYFEGVRTKEERETKIQAAEKYFLATSSSSSKGRGGEEDEEDAAAGTLIDIASLNTFSSASASTGDASTTELASALLGKLLVRLKPALLAHAAATTGTETSLAPKLPFKWPPSHDRDDSTAWLWAEDNESDGEGKEGGSGASRSIEDSAKATVAALNKEMDRYLSPLTVSAADAPTTSAKKVTSGKNDEEEASSSSSDMEELRGLLKKLSGFVRTTADYEGAEAPSATKKKANSRAAAANKTSPVTEKKKPSAAIGPRIDKESFLRNVQLHVEWQEKKQKGLLDTSASQQPPVIGASSTVTRSDEAEEDDEMISLSDLQEEEEERERALAGGGKPVDDEEDGGDALSRDEGEEEDHDEENFGPEDGDREEPLDDEDDQEGEDDHEDSDEEAFRKEGIPKELMDLKELMQAMEAELMGKEGSTLGKSFLKAAAASEGKNDGSTAPSAPLSDADVNYNLLSSLAASVGGQAGMAGPVSNMLGTLGAKIPQQWWKGDSAEDDEKDDTGH